MDLGSSGLSQELDSMDLGEGGLMLEGVEKRFFYELVENHILQFGGAIQAQNSLRGDNLGLEATWSSWSKMKDVLKALAFRWDAKGDPFYALGFSLNEGPAPTPASITQRWELADFLFQMGYNTVALKGAEQDMKTTQEAIFRAKTEAIRLIDSGEVKKGKGKGGVFGRWREAGIELVQYIHTLYPGTVLCLQLSEIQDSSQWQGLAAPPDIAKRMHDVLLKGGEVDHVFGMLGNKHVVLWAPNAMDDLNRMMGTLSKASISARGRSFQVTLVLPISIPPGVSDFDGVLDLVSHPLLGPKWDHLVKEKSILLEPGSFTWAGEYGPITSSKSFFLVSMGINSTNTGASGDFKREVIHWRECLAAWQVGRSLVVDIPSKYVHKLKQLLWCEGRAPFHKPLQWGDIEPSRASTKDGPRSACRGYFPQQGTSPLDFEIVCREVHERVKLVEGVVGSADLFQDKSALLMEVTNWDAVYKVRHMCKDLVSLSPKWALIKTQVRSEQWQEELSSLMRADPYCCVLRVMWRQSVQGGKTWATPAATMQQLQAVRVQAKQRLGGNANGVAPLKETTVQVRGSLGPDPAGVLRGLMDSMRIKSSMDLQEVPHGQNLQDGQWSICVEPESGRPTGRVRIQLHNSQQVSRLQKVAHQQVVSVGGTALPVSITNLQVTPLPKCSGNDQGEL